MRGTIVLAAIFTVIIIIILGYVSLNELNGNPPTATPSQSATPASSVTHQTPQTASPPQEFTNQGQIRDSVINYIKTQHNQTAPYMQDFMWTGGMMSNGMMVGSSNYSYQSNGWNVTMQYPITLNPKYTITANYTSLISEIFPPRNMIMWSGTWQNGTITETSYSFTP